MSLAVADLLVGFLVMPWAIYMMVSHLWVALKVRGFQTSFKFDPFAYNFNNIHTISIKIGFTLLDYTVGILRYLYQRGCDLLYL